MKKSIFLIFAAILYATSALGIGAKQCYVYFDNSTWNATNVKFVFWQDKGSNKFYIDTESMTTLLNTQLKYVRTTDHSSWNPAIAAFNFLECANASDWGDQELTWSNFQSWAQTKYTAKQSDWDFNGGYQLFTGAQTEKNKSVSGTYNSGYANLLEKKHTLKVMVSTDGGATYEQATTSPAKVTCQTYITKSATVTTSKTYTIAKDATTTSNSSVKAIYTAKTTLKAENIADGYTFVGWYDATNGTMISTSATPSAWYPKEAITLEARFSKEEAYPVTISYMCGSEEIESPATKTVGVSTASAITAPVIAGYNFSNWTLGSGVQSADANANPISITTKAGESDYTLVANYTEIPKTTIYFVNNKKWDAVCAYGWDGTKGANPAWPGQALTATGEKIGDFDIYSYTVEEGSYVKVIFNNNDKGLQTEDFVWTDGKYYYMGAAADYAGGTKEEVAVLVAPDPLATEVYLAGEMTNWGTDKVEFKKTTAEANSASVTVNLTAKTYEFKLIIDGEWKGNDGTMKRGGDAVHEGGWSFDGGNNCNIVADIAGDYTFTWNLTDKKLTVAYPPLPKHQVTATVNPAETGEVTGTGEYEQGSKATLVATPAAGYAFKNWTVGGTEKSTEATYTFTVNEPISLVANFIPEVTHEVTVSYLCNDTPIPGQAETKLAVGVTTPSTITAPAITNYKFDSWTLGTGVQSEDDSKNPISITSKSTGEYTLAANYTKIELTYNVTVPAGTEKCYIAGEMNSWAFQEMTKIDETHYTITIEGAEKTHKYKYTCGEGWDYVEKKADGSDIGDRTWKANDVVAKWGKPDTYTIAGTPATVFGKEWDATYTANDMKLQEDGTFVWSVTGLELTKTTNVAFKIVKNQNWETAWPAENKTIPVAEDGTYNLTIYFNAAEKDDATKNNGIYISLEKQAVVTPEVYTRTVTAGHYGTICLPYASSSHTGAEFYEVSWLQKSGETPVNLYLDQLAAGTQLEAGKPYIFRATSTELTVTCTGDAVADPTDGANGLTGSFDAIPAGSVLTGNYVVAQTKFWTATATAYAAANRAYIDASVVPTSEQAKIPGRRRVSLGAAGENAETGIDNIITTDAPVKVIENGQLIIIRNGEKFNVQGQKL